ncbi:MAG: YihY/virulence factor BrkB family protein [Rhodomicrobium sp.]
MSKCNPNLDGTPAAAGRQKRRTTVGIAFNIWKAISSDNISLLAAGVAFYTLLAIFPGLAFIVAVFALFSDPAQVQQELLSFKDVLPAEAWNAIDAQLLALTRQSGATLSIASIFSLALAFISARLGAYAMMGALNVIYKQPETRSFARINFIAILFTIGALLIFAFNVYAVVAVPRVLSDLGFTELSNSIVHNARWPVLAILMCFSLALIYRYGPDRKKPRWRWVSVGCITGTALWLAASAIFYWYVSQFNSFDRLYGSFGAVVILLYWLWLTAFAAMMGAELDMHIHTGLAKSEDLNG